MNQNKNYKVLYEQEKAKRIKLEKEKEDFSKDTQFLYETIVGIVPQVMTNLGFEKPETLLSILQKSEVEQTALKNALIKKVLPLLMSAISGKNPVEKVMRNIDVSNIKVIFGNFIEKCK